MILMAALVGAAVLTVNSAKAGVRFGFSFGVPAPVVVAQPAPVVVSAPALVYYAGVAGPAPVYYAGTVAPSPIVETVPTCPGVGYVWAPGYWAHAGAGFTWVRGNWHYQWRDRDDRHGDRDNYHFDRGYHFHHDRW